MCKENVPVEGEIFSVSFEDAMTWTKRWQELKRPGTDKHYPKSFRFRKEDFLEILDNEEVKFIRIYPCIEDDGTSMLAVGTDKDDVDLIKVLQPTGIYNFATPCPNTCGESPLNHDITE